MPKPVEPLSLGSHNHFFNYGAKKAICTIDYITAGPASAVPLAAVEPIDVEGKGAPLGTRRNGDGKQLCVA